MDGHTLGSHIAEGVLKNTNETLVARLKIEKRLPALDGQARHRRHERNRGGGRPPAEEQRGAVVIQSVAGGCPREREDSRRGARTPRAARWRDSSS